MPLKPPVSAAATQTIKTAFDQLDSVILAADSHDFADKTLEDVKKSVLLIEDQLAARNSLRNMRRLLPLFAGLEHYAKTVDILCNGTPFLPWVWAPITLVLRLACEYVEAFEKIVKGYARIADSLGRFGLLHAALRTDPEFQQTLAIFYADILKYHEYAYMFVRRKGWKLLFLTSWGRFERRFDNILEDMKRHEKLVDLHANAKSISDVREIRDNIKAWREDSLAQINRSNEDQAIKQYESIVAWLKADEPDQIAIVDAISSEGAKFAGTSSWILTNPRIRAWLQPDPNSPVACLQGAPGSGKSVLAGQLMNFAKQANKFLIQHFCSQRYYSSTTFEQILRSILLQLLRKNDELIAHVYEDSILGSKPTTIKALEKLLYDLFGVATQGPTRSGYTWILIDGLNECDSRTQACVVDLVNRITTTFSGSSDNVCKVLVSTRSVGTVRRLRTRHILSLTDEKDKITLAIRQYVSQRLRRMHEKLVQLHLEKMDIDELERLVTHKADGMFLYARLVLDYLSRNIFYTGQEMKDSVNQLPEELNAFYGKILNEVLVQLDPRSRERIRSIFNWIAFVKRPLKRIELLSALAFSAGNPAVDVLVPNYVLDACGALVEERHDTTFTFIHVSVKEYLQNPLYSENCVILETKAIVEHSLASLACLTSGIDIFLKRYDEDKKMKRVVKGIHAFHIYATEHWTDDLLRSLVECSTDDKSKVIRLASKFAKKLDTRIEVAHDGTNMLDPSVGDERLSVLGEWPYLKRLVQSALKARSSQRLEATLVYEMTNNIERQAVTGMQHSNSEKPSSKSTTAHDGDDVSAMLSSYQEVVRHLLHLNQYPGIPATELNLFKSQFRNSAFTCRLGSCPRATIGFASEDIHREHEIAHTKLCNCPVEDCKFPPMRSVNALKNHMTKYHVPKPIRRAIRQAHTPERLTGIQSGPVVPGPRQFLSEFYPRVVQEPIDSVLFDTYASRHSSISDRRDTSAPYESHFNAPWQEYLVSAAQTDRGNQPDNPELLIDFEPTEIRRSVLSELNYSVEEYIGKRFDAADFGYLAIDGMCFWRRCTIFACRKILVSSEVHRHNEHIDLLHSHALESHSVEVGNNGCWCAVTGCQTFCRTDDLQRHFQEHHMALVCKICYASEAPLAAYRFKSELYSHWHNSHLQRVQRWKMSSTGFTYLQSIEGITDCVCRTCKFESLEEVRHHVGDYHGLVLSEDLINEFFLEIDSYQVCAGRFV